MMMSEALWFINCSTMPIPWRTDGFMRSKPSGPLQSLEFLEHPTCGLRGPCLHLRQSRFTLYVLAHPANLVMVGYSLQAALLYQAMMKEGF